MENSKIGKKNLAKKITATAMALVMLAPFAGLDTTNAATSKSKKATTSVSSKSKNKKKVHKPKPGTPRPIGKPIPESNRNITRNLQKSLLEKAAGWLKQNPVKATGVAAATLAATVGTAAGIIFLVRYLKKNKNITPKTTEELITQINTLIQQLNAMPTGDAKKAEPILESFLELAEFVKVDDTQTRALYEKLKKDDKKWEEFREKIIKDLEKTLEKVKELPGTTKQKPQEENPADNGTIPETKLRTKKEVVRGQLEAKRDNCLAQFTDATKKEHVKAYWDARIAKEEFHRDLLERLQKDESEQIKIVKRLLGSNVLLKDITTDSLKDTEIREGLRKHATSKEIAQYTEIHDKCTKTEKEVEKFAKIKIEKGITTLNIDLTPKK